MNLRSWLVARKGDDKLGSTARAISSANVAAMSPDDRLADGKSQSDSASPVGRKAVAAEEFFKNLILCARRQAWSRVGDSDDRSIFVDLSPNVNLRAGRGIPGGIL